MYFDRISLVIEILYGGSKLVLFLAKINIIKREIVIYYYLVIFKSLSQYPSMELKFPNLTSGILQAGGRGACPPPPPDFGRSEGAAGQLRRAALLLAPPQIFRLCGN